MALLVTVVTSDLAKIFCFVLAEGLALLLEAGVLPSQFSCLLYFLQYAFFFFGLGNVLSIMFRLGGLILMF